jgi:hypothetical protein
MWPNDTKPMMGPATSAQQTTDAESAYAGIGLPVQLMSKVPDWGFPAQYVIDFVRRTFRNDWSKLSAENCKEISLQALKKVTTQ